MGAIFLVFAGIAFFIYQAWKDEQGRYWLLWIGIVVGVCLLIAGMAAFLSSLYGEHIGLITTQITILLVIFGVLGKYAWDAIAYRIRTTPEQRAARKQAEIDFKNFIALKNTYGNAIPPYAEHMRIRAEHPNGQNLSNAEVQAIYNREYIRKKFKEIYHREYEGTDFFPAVASDTKPKSAETDPEKKE